MQFVPVFMIIVHNRINCERTKKIVESEREHITEMLNALSCNKNETYNSAHFLIGFKGGKNDSNFSGLLYRIRPNIVCFFLLPLTFATFSVRRRLLRPPNKHTGARTMFTFLFHFAWFFFDPFAVDFARVFFGPHPHPLLCSLPLNSNNWKCREEYKEKERLRVREREGSTK